MGRVGLVLLLVVFSSIQMKSQNIYNGVLIESYTSNANVHLTSNIENREFIDGNLNTFWQSAPPLPENYIQRTDLNLLLSESYLLEASYGKELALMCDGNLQNNVEIGTKGDFSWVEIQLEEAVELKRLSVKLDVKQKVDLYFRDDKNKLFHFGSISPEENYQLKAFEYPGRFAKTIRLQSYDLFKVFEIAWLKQQPFESVMFDFKQPRSVGWLMSRHLSGKNDVDDIIVYGSLDGNIWEEITRLNPGHIGIHNFLLEKEKSMRYVKYHFILKQRDYAKTNLWEVGLYDKNGPYGGYPNAKRSKTALKDMMGVNVFWGLGSNKYSIENNGVNLTEKLASVFTHFRSYHNMDWDVIKPGIRADYNAMKNGQGKGKMNWIDWEKEYAFWKSFGVDIQAVIQFTPMFEDDISWADAYHDAYNYASDFVRYFGPSGKNLINTIEIGNEPWKMSDDLYQTIFSGMYQGGKDVDSRIDVMPCALQTGVDVVDNLQYQNSFDRKLNPDLISKIDGLNCHYYSYFRGDDEQRYAVWPEHKGSSFRGILNEVRNRYWNLPSKPVYVTEFGWDSNGGNEDCTHSECVGEREQALYAVRAFLIMARLNIERAYWFYYANENSHSTVYTRSGLFSSVNNQFKPKQVYNALKLMRETIGELYFHSVVEENEHVYCYKFCDKAGIVSHMVVWRPISGSNTQSIKYQLSTKFKIKSTMVLDGLQHTSKPYNRLGISEVLINSAPLLIELY